MAIHTAIRAAMETKLTGPRNCGNCKKYMKNGITVAAKILGLDKCMKLKTLFKEIPVTQIRGSKELEITGISTNSKLIAPGNLFIARKGASHDGSHYIPEAVSGGAVAILTDIFDPFLDKAIAQVIHPNVAALESIIAAKYYKQPSNELFTVGITGTNGKTTTSFFIKHLLDALEGPCGLIGTIEYIIGQSRYQATRTTPDCALLHKMLREMVIQGCRDAVLEVTSHALQQGRVDLIDFDCAIFTNLTEEHLDYHRTMDEYCESKKRLFSSMDPSKRKKIHPYAKWALVNSDSPRHEAFIKSATCEVVTYGIDKPAMLSAQDIALSPEGSRFSVCFQGEKVPFFIPMAGRYNIYNALAAIGTALCRKHALPLIAKAMQGSFAVPGRLESIENALGLHIYVDFAHTPDALLNVCKCLKEFQKGRLITVFGCGGNRDAAKRPLMGAISERLADISILTSDNPRQENPMSIIEQIAAGFKNKGSYIVEQDRRSAIEKAVEMAKAGDIILVAGRGHEQHQVFAHKTIPFDDRRVVREICNQKALATEAKL